MYFLYPCKGTDVVQMVITMNGPTYIHGQLIPLKR